MKKSIFFMVFATLLTFLLYAAAELFLPVQTSDKNIEVEIPRGTTFRQAVELLNSRKLIRDKRIFLIMGRLSGADRRMRAGYYSLWTGRSPAEILHALRTGKLATDPGATVLAVADAQDVDLLHAAAASLGLAIGHAKGDAAMLARLPEVDALLARAIALDEGWNDGALHELAVSWRAARPGLLDRPAVDAHFARALELSRGTRPALFVAYAEAVAVPEQDRPLFESLLARALAVDPEARPQEQLQNALAKRRAQWLAARADRLFVE